MTPGAAMQLVYLVAGAETVMDLYRVTQRLKGTDSGHPLTEGGGHIGMVDELMPFAELVDQHLESLSTQDFPGVFEYEVTEMLGAWLARYAEQQAPGTASLMDAFTVEMQRQSDLFFAQGS